MIYNITLNYTLEQLNYSTLVIYRQSHFLSNMYLDIDIMISNFLWDNKILITLFIRKTEEKDVSHSSQTSLQSCRDYWRLQFGCQVLLKGHYNTLNANCRGCELRHQCQHTHTIFSITSILRRCHLKLFLKSWNWAGLRGSVSLINFGTCKWPPAWRR